MYLQLKELQAAQNELPYIQKDSKAESKVRELGHSTETPKIDFSYKP